jgi:thymidylate synthase
MQAFHEIVRRILNEGVRKPNRTGVPAISIAGAMFEHDMAKGFPLLTTKKTPFKVMATELEFFIKGLTDKHWLQERNCHIWDEGLIQRRPRTEPMTLPRSACSKNATLVPSMDFNGGTSAPTTSATMPSTPE